jgi:hypothetical protein
MAQSIQSQIIIQSHNGSKLFTIQELVVIVMLCWKRRGFLVAHKQKMPFLLRTHIIGWKDTSLSI